MKTVRIKSALPLYLSALVWILFGMFSPIYRLLYIAIAASVSFAVYLLASAFFPGKTVEVEKLAATGDGAIDRQIDEGRASIRGLVEANDAIEDERISAELQRMTDAGYKIFDALEADVSRASQVRRFMNYYLPTTGKLLKQYRMLMDSGSTGETVSGAMQSVENSLEMISTAFEKQLDSLYKHEALDIQTDIDVLETMLASDDIRIAPKK
jgi:hypothetical protein